ncbi:hypothetical protein SMQ_00557 [Enterococcus faecium EnGen0183]|nr:hypothetical protein SMQ_00557 [Enterococcus faecium EnGen0183]
MNSVRLVCRTVAFAIGMFLALVGPAFAMLLSTLISLINEGKKLNYLIRFGASYAGGIIAANLVGKSKNRIEKERLSTAILTEIDEHLIVIPNSSARSLSILT